MCNLKLSLKLILISALAILSGCASTQQVDGVNDPYENYNRTMYSFNKTLDKTIVKPAAQVYDTVLPDPIIWAISNFFSNLREVRVVINDLLQFKFEQAVNDFGRLALNTTVGFGGIFDVAGHAGHTANNEDFGQTLGVWGLEPGPYLVLPFLGPRNVRDTVGLVGDTYTHPKSYTKDEGARNALLIAGLLDTRVALLGIDNVLNEAATNEYNYVRNIYAQRRLNLVYDGNPPEEDFDVFSD
jgi:phospholipid-binding lipoprotein MlaA